MKTKSYIKNLFVILLLAIFSYQSWLTLTKYLERKTWYQVTTTDDETILFPSITFCKKFMYRQTDFIRNGFKKGPKQREGIIPGLESFRNHPFSLLKTGKLDIKKVKEHFQALTFTRSELVTFLNMNTLEGSNSFPCNTLTGLKPGAPCTFPFVYPDCKLAFKAGLCEKNQTSTPVQTGPPRCRGSSRGIATPALLCSLSYKGAYNRTFPCMEATYPYVIKNQRGASKIPL